MAINVPLPNGYMGLDDLPKQRENLINLANIGGSLMRTPGIAHYTGDSTATAGCRGAASWGVTGNAYFVLGSQLYEKTPTELRPITSHIGGTGRCHMVGGQLYLVIVAEDADAFTYDPATDTVSPIVTSTYKASQSVDHIDGRFVYVPRDGSPAFYSEVDDPTNINALSFFDAEEVPDDNKYVINVRNMLFLMGEYTTEVFTSTGDVTAPFARRNGSRIDYGYISGALRHDNTFTFIGRQRDQSPAIYAMGTGSAEQISNDAVTEDLNNNHTYEELQDAVANRFKWYGKDFLCWTIGDKTYAYCEGQWLFLDSELNGSESGRWQANGVVHIHGNYYTGSLANNRFGYLSDTPSEYGQSVEYQFDTFARAERGAFMRPSYVEVDALTGQNATTIGLSLSRDGRVKGDYFYRSLGATGRYQRRMMWQPPGGLGEYESFMGISIRGTGQVLFSAEGLYVG